MSNRAVADLFLEIADLLDLDGEKFKPEAYRRAARSLEETSTDVTQLVREHRQSEIPGVGEALAKKIEEYVTTGKIEYLERLRAQHPPGLLEVLHLDGMGPKTTRRLHLELGIDSPAGLKKAIEERRLEGLKGFGARKIELLRASVDRAQPRGRTPLPEADRMAAAVIEGLLAAGAPVGKLTFAGSLRRRKESVGDLDFVATSSRAREVMGALVHLPLVEEVKLSGETKTTVILHSGIQVDLRVVPEQAFGATLQYLTGSKDHNIRLRTLALERGLSLNEYGVARDEALVPTPTEEEVYAAVGLPFIPPELREDQGEIEAAQRGQLPGLLQTGEVSSEPHIHVAPETAAKILPLWAKELRRRRIGTA